MVQKIIYYTLKTYCTIALWFYFSRWQILRQSPIPEGPVIFVPNHQNAFLDAILLICSTQRTPWALTRAGVFNKPLVKKFLTLIHMMPVYRFRDGFGTLRKNDAMIENCVALLSAGKSILIFGEGNHNYQWYLRDLQKGFARIALAAEEKNSWKLGVKIVPVGIQYDSHNDFRSRALVTFGQPIVVNTFCKPATPSNVDLLLNETATKLKSLILHINPDQYEAKASYLTSHRIVKKDLVEQLNSDQAMVDQDLSPEGIPVNAEKSFTKWFNPIFLYHYVNHLLPHLIIRWVLRNKVSDPQFTGSLKYALGMVLTPVFYVFQTVLCFLLTGSEMISLLYLLSLPISVILRR